jgi:DNA-binding Lrp family transcriptional regulator
MQIVPNPWMKAAGELAMPQQDFFERIRHLKESGAIRRISGVLRHRRVGFTANGMACFVVSEEAIAEAGKKAAEFSEVSHCYQRRTYPDWPYSLFAMVHGKSRKETESTIRRIAETIDCRGYITLYSTEELKKERVKYFEESK